MELSRKQIRESVIAALKEVLELKKEAEPIINEITKPIRDLGLDSMAGIDYACALSEKLGWCIPYNINPLVNDELKRERSVRQIIDFVKELVSKERGIK